MNFNEEHMVYAFSIPILFINTLNGRKTEMKLQFGIF